MLTGMMWLVKQRRPLIYFGLPGAFLSSVGLAAGLWVIYTYSKTREIAWEYAIVSMPLLVCGIIILCTGIILYSMQEFVLAAAQAKVEVIYKSQPPRKTPEWVKRHWPLLFFVLPGTLLLLGSVAVGARVVITYNRTQALPMEYAFATVLLSIIGSLWLIGGTILHSIGDSRNSL
jgi:hypothetical protein